MRSLLGKNSDGPDGSGCECRPGAQLDDSDTRLDDWMCGVNEDSVAGYGGGWREAKGGRFADFRRPAAPAYYSNGAVVFSDKMWLPSQCERWNRGMIQVFLVIYGTLVFRE